MHDLFGIEMKFYAGIGARITPPEIQLFMTRIAVTFAASGLWTLRSGHAAGADQAFEKGCRGVSEIFLPWSTFNSDVPVNGQSFCNKSLWEKFYFEGWNMGWFHGFHSKGSMSLFGRNVAQIRGMNSDSPMSSLVICWTQNGANIGGTNIARYYEVPIYNLAVRKDVIWLAERVMSDFCDASKVIDAYDKIGG